jgi:hypothetical protein
MLGYRKRVIVVSTVWNLSTELVVPGGQEERIDTEAEFERKIEEAEGRRKSGVR